MVDLIKNIFSHDASNSESARARREIKSGFDSSGMPYIDLEDRDTAMIIKEKLKAFQGIKTIK